MKKSMLKLELVLKSGDSRRFMALLQDFGLLHLEGSDIVPVEPQTEDWKKWLDLKQWLDQDWQIKEEPKVLESDGDLFEKALHIKNAYGKLSYQIKQNQEQLDFFEKWPQYHQDHWISLKAAGLEHLLFEEKDLRSLADHAIPLSPKDGLQRALLLYPTNTPPILSIDPVKVPERSKAELEQDKLDLEKEENLLRSRLSYILSKRDSLQNWADQHFDHWQFEQGLELWQEAENQKLEAISAWYDKNDHDNLMKLLEQEFCAYRIREPQKGERIPVSLENGSYSKLFEPITKIFQLPHYHEFDLTPLIAVFYPILFAYCLGDAGYGALMSVVAIIGLFTFLKQQKGIAYLVLILGLSTTIMGLIKSGSLFGIALVPDHNIAWIASLSALVIVPDDSSYFFNAFNVALLIGVFQILIGLFIAIVKNWKYEGFKSSLSHWGKLFIVVGSISLFMTDSLGLEEMETLLMQGLLVMGILLVMFFHDLNQRILNRIGGSVLPLFFIFTGLLGDVLSYVRLFALGVTSAVLGLVVNQIGMNMMGDSWLSILGASIFLLFGHSLNLVLAVLGSFIHPLRLTFVEFYNNAQFEGGGIEFKPFQKSNRLNITNHGNS